MEEDREQGRVTLTGRRIKVTFFDFRAERMPFGCAPFDCAQGRQGRQGRQDVKSRPMYTSHSRIDGYHQKECGGG
jgi:hypothetical protein